MSWIACSLIAAFFLGCYELCTKHAVRENAVLPVLFLSTVCGALVWGTLLLVQPSVGLGASGTVYVDGDVYVPAYYHFRGPWLLAASGSIIVGHDAKLEQVWLWAGQHLTAGDRVQLVGGAWSKDFLQIGEQAHLYGAAPPLFSELPSASADVFLLRSWNTYELKEGL